MDHGRHVFERDKTADELAKKSRAPGRLLQPSSEEDSARPRGWGGLLGNWRTLNTPSGNSQSTASRQAGSSLSSARQQSANKNKRDAQKQTSAEHTTAQGGCSVTEVSATCQPPGNSPLQSDGSSREGVGLLAPDESDGSTKAVAAKKHWARALQKGVAPLGLSVEHPLLAALELDGSAQAVKFGDAVRATNTFRGVNSANKLSVMVDINATNWMKKHAKARARAHATPCAQTCCTAAEDRC